MPPKQKKQHELNQKGSGRGEQTSGSAEVRDSQASLTTNYTEIQLNELEALRSIYPEEFEEVKGKPAAWNKRADVAFKLRLKSKSEPPHPQLAVTLHVDLPATYPKTLPRLRMTDFSDFKPVTKEHILDLVESKPHTLLGNEMIFDLATSIEEILENAAQSQKTNEEVPSLEEERRVREAAAEQEAKQQEQDLLRKQKEETAEEERVLAQAVDAERKRRNERSHLTRRKSKPTALENDTFDDPEEFLPSVVNFNQPLTMADNGRRPLTFRKVYGKTKIHSTADSETFTVRPLLPKSEASHPLIILKTISLAEKASEAGTFRDQIRLTEEKLEALKKLRHPNLVLFFGFRIEPPLRDEDEDGVDWKINLLLEYADKGSLPDILDLGRLDVETVRLWIIQLLEALDYYHRNGIVHGNIHCGKIMLFKPRTGAIFVKLLCGFQTTLPQSLWRAEVVSSKSPFWCSPELAQDGAQRSSKTDVWDLGIVFLQMGLGKDVLQTYTSSNALIDALDLSESFEVMVREIFRPDPRKRPSAFDLLPSEFLRVDAPIVSISTTSMHAQLPKTPRRGSTTMSNFVSRYANDFVETGRLGKGGFGEVVKVRNKLDGHIYAVKKISQSSASALKSTLSEIMLLSRLNHPYVVRYFATWLEEDFGEIKEREEEAVSSTEDPSTIDDDNVDFGYSTGGLDFISSSGHPRIKFQADSDDESEDEESGEEDGEVAVANAVKDDKRSRSTSDLRPVKSTLYIQMEYCEKQTLRDLIRNSLYENVDECWRLFRQILDGLCHIHSHGIIHRDLKPENVFIDVGNNPRIGDFGLATSGQFSSAFRASSPHEVRGSLTHSIGTTYYVAPELKSVAVGNYNEKVDMYSFGVIFFEMCHPLKTSMERDHILRGIREKDPVLPPDFQSPEKANQRDIIMSLLKHRPAERPSANELLKSGRIPMDVKDETFRQALRGLSDSDSPQYHNILSALFSQVPKKVQDFVWDHSSKTSPSEMVLQGIVKEKLASVFRRHGALETQRQLLFPRSEHYSSGVVKLLEPSGNIVQLPFDLTLPNARAISRQDSSFEKTYSFGNVYRESLQGGEPRSHGEVDFDIVSHNTLDLALKEAEVIKVLDEVIEEFPSLRSAQMSFHVNHSDLLDAIFEYCHIDAPQRPAVKEVISKLNIGQWSWLKIREELRSSSIGVASTALDELMRFDFRETSAKAQQKLLKIFEGTQYLEILAPIFARLNAVIKYLDQFNVKRKIYINPLSCFNDKFYRGSILFQCVSNSKRREVFAAGGRYDRLIQQLRPKITSTQPHAVGFNLGWDSLCMSMVNYLKNASKKFVKQGSIEGTDPWRGRRCDVLVASFDPSILRTTGIKILQELWNNDISAELAVDLSSMEELVSRYKDDNHSWIAMIRQDSSAMGERSLKVKSVVKKEDTDVRIPELMGWLRSELRDRDQREGTSDAKLIRQPSHQDGNGSAEDREVEVRVLSSQHRGKKTNRRNVIEAAHLKSKELVNGFLDGPIAAIETRDEILDAMRDTRLFDQDSWRNLIQNAPLVERHYLGQVRDLLLDLSNEEKAKDGTRNAFIFNYRTGHCIYYDLGWSN